MLDDLEGPPQVSMVRVLLILAIGIPIIIEVVTFGGLIGHYMGGGGADPAAATATETPAATGATAGDEILDATAPNERITAASVTTGDDSWQFTLTVNVTGVGDRYELRLGAVTTDGGNSVEGSGSSTGTLAAGESGTVTGTWALPSGERPASVSVTAVTTPDDGTATATDYTVAIGDVPVSN
jgi:hypothetical protein